MQCWWQCKPFLDAIEISAEVPQLKIGFSYDPAVPLLGTYMNYDKPLHHKHTCTTMSTQYYSQHPGYGTRRLSTNRWRNERNRHPCTVKFKIGSVCIGVSLCGCESVSPRACWGCPGTGVRHSCKVTAIDVGLAMALWRAASAEASLQPYNRALVNIKEEYCVICTKMGGTRVVISRKISQTETKTTKRRVCVCVYDIKADGNIWFMLFRCYVRSLYTECLLPAGCRVGLAICTTLSIHYRDKAWACLVLAPS